VSIKASDTYWEVSTRNVEKTKTLKNGTVKKWKGTVTHKRFNNKAAAEAYSKTIPGSCVIEGFDFYF